MLDNVDGSNQVELANRAIERAECATECLHTSAECYSYRLPGDIDAERPRAEFFRGYGHERSRIAANVEMTGTFEAASTPVFLNPGESSSASLPNVSLVSA
jgi:hypothetical protein